MKRILIFIYGLIAYLGFLFVYLYAIGFMGNFIVSRSIDSGPEGPLGTALLVNVTLLGLFAIQHSVMARKWFKNWWTRLIPEEAERSTYVLISDILLFIIFWNWQPMGGVIWDVHNTTVRFVLYSLFISGWVIVVLTSFLINHFDLFGLRQVYLYLKGREYINLEFQVPFLYRYVRHPLYIGWLLAFWATPKMTIAHLLFAVVTTVYIFMAIRVEEKDLIERFGEKYSIYRSKVPMIIPSFKKDIRTQLEEIN